MSIPKGPYYYVEDQDVYHWEKDCVWNKYPHGGWIKSDEKPKDKEQCNTCKTK